MGIFVSNHSSYPKIGEKPEEQRLRRAYDQFDRREATSAQLDEVIRETIRQTVAEQKRGGADLVTDGQIRWNDPVSHSVRPLTNVKIGGLLRFFDTNCYFRVPRFESIDLLLEGDREDLTQDFQLTQEASSGRGKPVLTGPLTVAALSERGPGVPSLERLLESLTERIEGYVGGLSALGASWIQIEEPILGRRPELFPHLCDTLKRIAGKKGRSKIVLTTYFSDMSPFFEKLVDLPVDGLGLDCLYGPRLLDEVGEGPAGKTLFLGVVDGRSTRLEGLGGLVKKVRKICSNLGDRDLFLTSSCGLEYLPKARAFEKLSLLASLKEKVLS